jgi:protein phosphatase
VALRIAEHASITDVGMQRHTNEDSFYEAPPVFAVADGMGGAQAGEVASAMAVEAFGDGSGAGSNPEQQLERIITEANSKIWETAQADTRHAGMGTTMTAVQVGDTDMAVGHVGDSRLYRFRDGTLEQLTRDHSLVEEFVRQGRLTREQAERHPQRSVITRALGPEESVEVDTFTVPLKDGDVYLLCSDGLSGMVSDEAMEKILASGRPVADAGTELIAAANENGGRDNITAVLFRIEEEGGNGAAAAPPAEQETIAGGQQAPSAEEIDAARAAQASAVPIPGERASPRGRIEPVAPSPRPRPAQRRRGRSILRPLAAAVVILAIAGGALYGATRAFWFVGTDDSGAVTLYRGLPYELPLGLQLYTERYVSGVPASQVPAARRKRILDHQLRSRDDAEDLVRRLDVAASR